MGHVNNLPIGAWANGMSLGLDPRERRFDSYRPDSSEERKLNLDMVKWYHIWFGTIGLQFDSVYPDVTTKQAGVVDWLAQLSDKELKMVQFHPSVRRL